MEEAIQILEGAKKTLGPESPIHGFPGHLYFYYLNQTTRLTVSYGPLFKFAGSPSKKASLFSNTRFFGQLLGKEINGTLMLAMFGKSVSGVWHQNKCR